MWQSPAGSTSFCRSHKLELTHVSINGCDTEIAWRSFCRTVGAGMALRGPMSVSRRGRQGWIYKYNIKHCRIYNLSKRGVASDTNASAHRVRNPTERRCFVSHTIAYFSLPSLAHAIAQTAVRPYTSLTRSNQGDHAIQFGPLRYRGKRILLALSPSPKAEYMLMASGVDPVQVRRQPSP